MHSDAGFEPIITLFLLRNYYKVVFSIENFSEMILERVRLPTDTLSGYMPMPLLSIAAVIEHFGLSLQSSIGESNTGCSSTQTTCHAIRRILVIVFADQA